LLIQALLVHRLAVWMARINDGSSVINLASEKVRKQTALFDEFRETGMSEKLGYNSVGDLRANYPDLFWKTVRPCIGDAFMRP
jgi:hypothetical protein